MAEAQLPIIFSAERRIAARRRMLVRQQDAQAPRYILDDMIDDVIERLGFLRHAPRKALVIGDHTGALARRLECAVDRAEPAEGFRDDLPFPGGDYDFIACVGTLDTVNDAPGALIHMRRALAPGGLMLASLLGAGSLPALRGAMLAADGERPAARMHPMIDVRAGGQLLQRAGFSDPVVDSRPLDVRFSSFARLVDDLRAQGLGAVLARHGPPLGRSALARAEAAFAAPRVERFEILTLSGWRR